MKASEARATAATVAAKKELAREAKNRRDKVAREAAAKRARAEFKTYLTKSTADSIAYAVSEGDTSTRLSLTPTKNSPVEAQQAYDKHEYIDLIKALLLKLNRDGYKIKTGVQTNEYTTNHESSVPDYNYYDYHHYIDVSW